MVAAVFSHILRRDRGAAWALAVVLALAAGPALAQSGSWNVDADGLWSGTTNWLGNVEAKGNASTATFANDITFTRTVTLDVTRALGNVVFGDANTTSAASWIVSGTTLTINNNTNSGTITVNALGTGATATISSVLAGGTTMPSIVKNGVGTLVLSNTNSFANKLAITSGTLQVSTDRNLGATGSFATDRITISNGAALRTTAAFTMNGARGITIGSGGGTLNLNGGALTYAGRFTGAGQTLTTVGSAGLTISNTTGTPTDVNWDFTGGNTRIFVSGTNALGTGSARVRNTVRLVSTAATGTFTNAITVDSGGGIGARNVPAAFSNVVFPSAGTIVLNKDDVQSFGLTISSNASLTGALTVDTSQQAAAAVGDVTLSGIFSGVSGALIKSGTGTSSGRLILDGANTYGGNTTINTGTLALGAAGSIANSAAIILSTGSTTFDVSLVTGGFSLGAAQSLTGVGTVLGNVSSLGTIAPGLSPGTLTFANNLSLDSGSILSYELSGTDTTVGSGINDLSSVTGNLTLGGTLNVTETVAGSFLSAVEGDSWRIFSYSGSLTGGGLSLGSVPTLSSGKSFQIDTSTANQVNLVVVPEPATIVTVMAGLGMLGMVAARRRLRRVER